MCDGGTENVPSPTQNNAKLNSFIELYMCSAFSENREESIIGVHIQIHSNLSLLLLFAISILVTHSGHPFDGSPRAQSLSETGNKRYGIIHCKLSFVVYAYIALHSSPVPRDHVMCVCVFGYCKIWPQTQHKSHRSNAF